MIRISDTISQLVLPSGPAPRKLLQNMQPGQLLQATVVSLDKPTVARLSMGPIEVLAHTKLPLSVGQRVMMEVVKGGEMPELRLIREPTTEELKARVLRQILPNQTQPARLLEGLRSLQANLPQTKQAFEALAKLQPPLPGLSQGKAPTAPASPTTAASPTVTAPSQARPTPDAINTLRTLIAMSTLKVTPQLVTTLQNMVTNAKSQQLPSDFIKIVQQFVASPKEKLSPELLNAAQRLVVPPKEGMSTERPLPPQGPSGSTPSAEGKAPPTLEKAMQSLLARILPGDTKITPSQIRRSLVESGLFLENRLASGEPPANDFKANLLRLLFLLRPIFGQEASQPGPSTPSAEPRIPAGTIDNAIARLFTDLLRQSEGSLARVQTHQLSSLPTEDGGRQVWQFEIPIQHRERIDDFLIRLEQEQTNKNGQDETIWKLTLNFDVEPLGPVAASLSLQGEEISSLFQAEHAESAALIERHLPQLNEAFIRAGLKVGQLHAHHGEIDTDSSNTSAPSVTLLDERA